MDAKIGSVVISKAGRDKGRFLVVIDIDENTFTVADGKERPLSRPKRKNIRHLSVTGMVLTDVQMSTDRSLRRALNMQKAEPND